VATAKAAKAAKTTATAAKANDDDDDCGGGDGDSDGEGSDGGGGGGGGGDDGDDDGNDDRLARDDRIDGGRRGPPAPRGRTTAALSSPSGQAPSADMYPLCIHNVYD